MFRMFLSEVANFEPTYTYINYSSSSGSSFWSEYKFYLPMAILCFVVAAWMLYTKAYRYSLLKKACTHPVEARMYSVDSKHGGRGGRFWNITYEFFYNERRYFVNNDFWERIGTRYSPQEGDVVGIYINPLNPNEIYDIVVKKGRFIGFFAGLFFVAVGVFCLLIPVLQ